MIALDSIKVTKEQIENSKDLLGYNTASLLASDEKMLLDV
jgi:hypothetical protein